MTLTFYDPHLLAHATAFVVAWPFGFILGIGIGLAIVLVLHNYSSGHHSGALGLR